MNQIRKKVLFVAEAVTLAQVVRLVALARSLPEERFEVHFASSRFDPLVFAGTRFTRWPIRSIPPARAERAMRLGQRLYDRRTLAGYVEEDLRLIEMVRPDLIVGDLRWSLAVSGPASGVKVATLCNAYWSPFAQSREFPLPEHPLVRLLGVTAAAHLFPLALPAVFRWFSAPLDDLRVARGLSPLGSLPEVLTWGDFTLYADPPALFAMHALPASHHFLGPVHWAPDLPWTPPETRRPLAYVTLGSSGATSAVPVVLEALASLDVEVLLATAGRVMPHLPPNARAAEFVRGDLAARAAAVVISNGGSSTGYQALAEGTPVVGLPFNLDQYLSMTAIEQAGAGVLVRSGSATARSVRSAVERALCLREGARAVARKLRALKAPDEFLRLVEEATGGLLRGTRSRHCS